MRRQRAGGLQETLPLALLNDADMDQTLASPTGCNVVKLPSCRQASNGANRAWRGLQQ